MPLINPESALILVGIAFNKRQRGKSSRYVLIFYDDVFACIPTEKLRPDHYNLGFFTESQLEKGLACADWNCLSARIGIMMRKMEVKIEEGTSKS